MEESTKDIKQRIDELADILNEANYNYHRPRI